MIEARLLSQVEFFEGLSEQQLASIADLCQEVSFQKGEVLFREGHEAERLYVLLEGEITIFIQLSSRPARITMSIISEPGQIFGWARLVAPYYYTASAQAEIDIAALAIDGQALMELLEQEPAMGRVVVQRLSELISIRLGHTRTALLETM